MSLKDGQGRFLLVLGTVAAFAILSSTMSKNPALPLLAEHIGANAEQWDWWGHQPDSWHSRVQHSLCLF